LYRAWTQSEYAEAVQLRNSGASWGQLAKRFNTSKENARAAYRRAVGAKHGAYLQPVRWHHANPHVAVVDIETLPMVIYSWGLWEEHNSPDQIIQDSCMLSWAGKYLNGSKIYSDIFTPDEARARDTRRIAKSIWEFLHDADVVIGHNYNAFDRKYINTMFLKNGLPPLKYTVVDTLEVARRNFKFASNKMKFINQELGIRQKIENDGFPLWKACSEGDKHSLDVMLEYNEGDILATEDLFYKLRPYVKNLNVALYNELETHQCPVCGSENLQIDGWYYTPAGKWESIRCQNCGALVRSKYNELDKDKRKSLLVNS